MQTSPNGRKFIEHWEGLFLHAYDDYNDRIVGPGDTVHGTLTIGYGHTSSAGRPRVYIGMSITSQQADDFLSADLTGVELQVAHLVKVSINQNQFDALVSFEYNTDWLAHPHCSLLTSLNSGNYNLADQDFMLYDRAHGVVLTGLSNRRKAEKVLFSSPVAVAKMSQEA